jgi:putative flippase GtrA
MSRFIAYLLAGGVAALLNWSSRFLFSLWFNYPVSIVLAFIVGLISGFALMRWLVFDGAGKSAATQVPFYLLVNLLALLQTLCVSLILAKWVIPGVGLSIRPEGPAHLIGVLVPVVTSYFGHKYFTFK